MLNEPTREKLAELRLHAMNEAWKLQQEDADSSSDPFDVRFGHLVDAEWIERQNKRLGRALREAQLRIRDACLEDVAASPSRGLEKAFVRELATCRWVVSHHNLTVTGSLERSRQDVRGVFPCAAGLPQGIPGLVSPGSTSV